MKPNYKRWYNKDTGKYTDDPVYGSTVYYISRNRIEVTYDYEDIINPFPSKQALIESLLTPKEKVRIGAEMCSKGDAKAFAEAVRNSPQDTVAFPV